MDDLVPRQGLSRFLDERFGASDLPLDVSRLGEGHSNLTFLVTRGERQWVLRRPPRGEILPSTHDMSREFRVMSAIEGAGLPVPVPRPIAMCEDTSYIDSTFYLMEPVEGVVVRDEIPDVFDSPESRRALGETLADTLAAIHEVDWRGAGLEGFARKPGEFLVRNLVRMQQLYDLVRGRDIPEIDQLGDWLRAHAPQQRESTLTHGDYKLDNVMFAPAPPPRIVAVVDWEISTVGDPLVDLGWMLYFSLEAGDPAGGFVRTIATQAPGYPTRAELAQRYAKTSGREIDNLRFYAALAGWKIAIIMESSYRRWLDGMADDPMFETLDEYVPSLARRSLDVISGAVGVE
ncbi:MAG TPA: phosphotransferase family protein [Actinomycetota bacterium]|nr:phosphotransferase family protein [Actinomycetota bacterium]